MGKHKLTHSAKQGIGTYLLKLGKLEAPWTLSKWNGCLHVYPEQTTFFWLGGTFLHSLDWRNTSYMLKEGLPRVLHHFEIHEISTTSGWNPQILLETSPTVTDWSNCSQHFPADPPPHSSCPNTPPALLWHCSCQPEGWALWCLGWNGCALEQPFL